MKKALVFLPLPIALAVEKRRLSRTRTCALGPYLVGLQIGRLWCATWVSYGPRGVPLRFFQRLSARLMNLHSTLVSQSPHKGIVSFRRDPQHPLAIRGPGSEASDAPSRSIRAGVLRFAHSSIISNRVLRLGRVSMKREVSPLNAEVTRRTVGWPGV